MLSYLKIRTGNNNLLLLLMLIIFAFSSCEDVFETDIENKTIRLLSPADSMTSTTNLVYFSWETLDGVDKYNFQIVSNTFANPILYICDSNVTTNFISYVLPPGSYQWRVKGINFGYSTNYSYRSFKISLSNDISGVIPQLYFPVFADTTKITSFCFKWNLIPYAVDYRFELWQGKIGNGTKICSLILDTNTFQYTLSSEGNYEWQVRGQNNSSNTPFSISSIYCDTTRPANPVLSNPQNNSIIADSNIVFQWTRTNCPGSVEYDSLLLYSDSLMNFKIGAYKVLNKSYSTLFHNGNYWWIIKPYDRAGNIGNSSGLSKFSINYSKSGK